MSDPRPDSPVRRPDTARPREAPVPHVEPPSPAELAAIQRHLVSLPVWEGAHADVDDELGVTLVRGPGNGPDTSYAAMPRWSAEAWPDRLRLLGERMRGAGAWPSLLWCEGLDQPEGLDRHLEQQGWIRAIAETVLWVGHASVVPHLDPALRIEAVQRRTTAMHESLERSIFGIAASHADRRRDRLLVNLDDGRLRAWIVWLGDEPVAVARLSLGDGVAAIHGVGVVPGRRSQGFGTLVTTVATRAGLALGNRLVWLSVQEENEAARRVYSRLGFEPAFAWSRYLVTEDPRPRA